MRPFSALLALLVAIFVALPAEAVELDYGRLQAELDAELRTLFTFTRAPQLDRVFPGIPGVPSSGHGRDSGLLLTRARVSLEGTYDEWLSGEIVYDNEARTGQGLDSLAFAIGRELGNGTWLDADRPISDHEDLFWRHLLYRGWLRYESDAFELTIGRQRIALGRGRLWNPTDLFNPIPALAVEGDQRIGQDAAVARYLVAPGLSLVGIWSPQDDPDDHRIAGRVELSRTTVDAAVLVARIREDYVFGGDFAANLGDAAVRGEATFTHLQTGGRIWQAVASVDYTFDIGRGLYLLVEHFFNENLVPPVSLAGIPPGTSPEAGLAALLGSAQALDEIGSSRLVSRVRNRTGVQLGYDITALLRADVLWLHDWNGPSDAFVPILNYQWRDDVTFTLGTQLFYGQGSDTEYGDVPNLFFFQMDAYF